MLVCYYTDDDNAPSKILELAGCEDFSGRALLVNSDKFSTILRDAKVWAVGLEYGRKTIAGPLRLGAHWCNETGFGATLSFGFDF